MHGQIEKTFIIKILKAYIFFREEAESGFVTAEEIVDVLDALGVINHDRFKP